MLVLEGGAESLGGYSLLWRGLAIVGGTIRGNHHSVRIVQVRYGFGWETVVTVMPRIPRTDQF